MRAYGGEPSGINEEQAGSIPLDPNQKRRATGPAYSDSERKEFGLFRKRIKRRDTAGQKWMDIFCT